MHRVLLLQETHLTPAEHETLKRMEFSRVYCSSYKSGHRRGVAILISQKVSYEHLSEASDKERRCKIVSGKIDGTLP